MRVSIGSDHAGFEQKQALVDYLVGKGYDVIDRGPDNDDRVDYPDYAAPVAHDVADGTAERGVLVCGTGIGMAMAADKVPGVRAANIINSEFAASTTMRTSSPFPAASCRSRRTSASSTPSSPPTSAAAATPAASKRSWLSTSKGDNRWLWNFSPLKIRR